MSNEIKNSSEGVLLENAIERREIIKALNDLDKGKTRGTRMRLMEMASEDDTSGNKELIESRYRGNLSRRFTGSPVHLLFEAAQGSTGEDAKKEAKELWKKYYYDISGAVMRKAPISWMGKESKRGKGQVPRAFPEYGFFEGIANTPVEDLYVLEAIFETLEKKLASKKEAKKIHEAYKKRILDDFNYFLLEPLDFFGIPGAPFNRDSVFAFYVNNRDIIGGELRAKGLPKDVRLPNNLKEEDFLNWLSLCKDNQMYWAKEIWLTIKENLKKEAEKRASGFRSISLAKLNSFLLSRGSLDEEGEEARLKRHSKILKEINAEGWSIPLPEDASLEGLKEWVEKMSGKNLYHMKPTLKRLMDRIDKITQEDQKNRNRIANNFMNESALQFLLRVVQERGGDEVGEKINMLWRKGGDKLNLIIKKIREDYSEFPPSFYIDEKGIRYWLANMDSNEVIKAEMALRAISHELNEEAFDVEDALRKELLESFDCAGFMQDSLEKFGFNGNQTQRMLADFWYQKNNKQDLPERLDRDCIAKWLKGVEGVQLLAVRSVFSGIESEIFQMVEGLYRRRVVKEFFADENVKRLMKLYEDPATKVEAENIWNLQQNQGSNPPKDIDFKEGEILNWLEANSGDELIKAALSLNKIADNLLFLQDDKKRNEILIAFLEDENVGEFTTITGESLEEFWDRKRRYAIATEIRIGHNLKFDMLSLPESLEENSLRSWMEIFSGKKLEQAESILLFIQNEIQKRVASFIETRRKNRVIPLLIGESEEEMAEEMAEETKDEALISEVINIIKSIDTLNTTPENKTNIKNKIFLALNSDQDIDKMINALDNKIDADGTKNKAVYLDLKSKILRIKACLSQLKKTKRGDAIKEVQEGVEIH